MDIQRFGLKFFARPGFDLDEAIFIDIFQEWIRRRALGGILLDVADYRHVPNGPGLMLITHEINFALDQAEGRFGLLAQRKLGQAEGHPARILELAQATAAFGALLEADPRLGGKLRLEAGGFHYIANDRLLAPNDEAGFTAVRPALEAAATALYPGQTVSLERVANHPRDRLTVAVESGTALGFADLAAVVGAVA